MDGPDTGAVAVLARLMRAVNERDIEGLVSCFADDYANETPVHPQRQSVDGNTAWTEWDMSGTRVDGLPFLMRGVVIFRIVDDAIASARFYLEPVEETSGDVDVHTTRVAGQPDAVARAGVTS
jgi:hypothetical protein